MSSIYIAYTSGLLYELIAKQKSIELCNFVNEIINKHETLRVIFSTKEPREAVVEFCL